MHQRLTTAAMNIRPVRADDTLLMQTFLQGLGDESRRHRFHGAVNVCSSGLLRLMTCADGSRHVAWVVVPLKAAADCGLASMRSCAMGVHSV